MSAWRSKDEVPEFARKALSQLVGERYSARKKLINLWNNQFHIYGPARNVRFFVVEKFLAPKKSLTIYRDETMTRPLLKIRSRRLIQFSPIYDVTTPAGQKIGALQRNNLKKNIIRDQWLILDAMDREIGRIEEDSTKLALVRRMVLGLLPKRFDVTIRTQKVAVFRQHYNPFVSKLDVDLSLDPHGLLDRRIAIASVALLLAMMNSRG